VLLFGGMIRPGVHFGTRATFADLGQTLADALGVPALEHGVSFWPEVLR
jgi:phosphopentomutase